MKHPKESHPLGPNARGVRGLPKGNPAFPPDYEIADVAALQAVYYGRANEDQQRHAYQFIMYRIACVDDVSFRGEKTHDTAFAEGKRFVGSQLRKFSQLNIAQLRGKNTEQGEAPKGQTT